MKGRLSQNHPTYSVTWSLSLRTYEVRTQPDGSFVNILAESPSWFDWLDTVSSFAFQGQSGSFTARKETRQRGDVYWYAYLKSEGNVSKKYVGKTAHLTLSRLEHIAREVSAIRDTSLHPSQGMPPQQGQQAEPSTPFPHADTGSDLPRGGESSTRAWHETILVPKLSMPRSPVRVVSRVHLLERLQQRGNLPLTLLAAPAGFGKTTVLSSWLQRSSAPVAWVTLDKNDNELPRFWASTCAALERVCPGVGEPAMHLLRAQPPTPVEAVLTQVINRLTELSHDVVLALDDYHVITLRTIQDAVMFFLDHMPPHLRMYIATRADPPLPLARLRSRDLLLEFRANDLRFTLDETALFLGQIPGLTLSHQEITALETRTEGWIAGLQLAALSLQDNPDISGFIQAFTGTHHYIADYLAQEVLARQPERVQNFLLQTSILQHLQSSLCEAVTGQEGGQMLLERLAEANLFLAPIDQEQQWYRYHQLFADWLRHRLQRKQPALVPELHRRASAWFEQHGFIHESIHHALAAKDFELAGRLIQQHGATMLVQQGEITTLQSWLEAFPQAHIRSNAALCIMFAWVRAILGSYAAAEAVLDEVERELRLGLLSSQTEQSSNVSAPFLPGEIAGIRAFIARRQGDYPNSIALARQALRQISKTSPSRGMIAWNLGTALRRNGDIQAASGVFEEVRKAGQAQGSHYINNMLSFELASLHILQGHLFQAEQIYRHVLHSAEGDSRAAPVSGPARIGLGELYYEWNQLEIAARFLQEGLDQCLHMGTVHAIPHAYIGLAWTRQALGDEDGARAMLEQAIQIGESYQFAPQWKAEVAAHQARLALQQGNRTAALRWMQECGLNAHDEDGSLMRQREMEYLTLIRVSLAQRKPGEAAKLLERLLLLAQAEERFGRIIEILLLQALTQQAQGDTATALETLVQALSLAEPQQYTRLFVDEGKPLTTLLFKLQSDERKKQQNSSDSVSPAYVTSLLAALGVQAHSADGMLADLLNEREGEILLLIAAGYSNRAIADRLVLAVSTVKWYVNSIYGKLQVESRTQAIARARELGLL